MYWTSIREVLFPEHLSRTKKLLFLPSIYSFHSSSPATSLLIKRCQQKTEVTAWQLPKENKIPKDPTQ